MREFLSSATFPHLGSRPEATVHQSTVTAQCSHSMARLTAQRATDGRGQESLPAESYRSLSTPSSSHGSSNCPFLHSHGFETSLYRILRPVDLWRMQSTDKQPAVPLRNSNLMHQLKREQISSEFNVVRIQYLGFILTQCSETICPLSICCRKLQPFPRRMHGEL